MERCETCGRKLDDKTMRFCPPHAKKELRRLAVLGYLEPLEYQGMDGRVRLSRKKFLTLEAEMETFGPKSSD